MKTTKVKIVGIGERISGVKANGQPYDFAKVAFLYPDAKIDGWNAAVCTLSGSELDEMKIVPGCEVDCFLLFKQVSKYERVAYIGGVVRRY